MNVQWIGKAAAVVVPVIKKYGPIAVGAISGAIGAAAKIKAEARVDSMDKRIADLEALIKK